MNSDANSVAANAYVLGHANTELNRLIEQGKFFGDLTVQVLRAAGIGPGMRVIDVGCGAGDVSFLAADLVGPTGTVVGVDRSTEAVTLATTRAKSAGLSNMRFVAHDVSDLTLDALSLDAPADALIGRLVLMYFPDPAAVLRRLLDLLDVNGLIAFHEFDLHAASSEPHVPIYELSVGRATETIRRSGASPRMGLRLPQTFRQAGLPTPQMMAHGRVCVAEDKSVFMQIAAVTRTLLPAMEKFGIATAAEVNIDTLAERMQAAAVSRDATLIAPLFVGAWCRKSAQ